MEKKALQGVTDLKPESLYFFSFKVGILGRFTSDEQIPLGVTPIQWQNIQVPQYILCMAGIEKKLNHNNMVVMAMKRNIRWGYHA